MSPNSNPKLLESSADDQEGSLKLPWKRENGKGSVLGSKKLNKKDYKEVELPPLRTGILGSKSFSKKLLEDDRLEQSKRLANLKERVDSGNYKPEKSSVAAAILKHLTLSK